MLFENHKKRKCEMLTTLISEPYIIDTVFVVVFLLSLIHYFYGKKDTEKNYRTIYKQCCSKTIKSENSKC
jgi:hypothetical protein